MKNILTPIEQHTAIDSVLETALLLGKRFESYIEGVPLGPDLPDLVAFDMPVSWTVTDQNTWRELAEEGKRRFEQFMEAHGVTAYRSGETPRLSWGWAGESSYGDSHVGSYGRIFDITVLGRPGSERGAPRMATAEAALFESRRPILLAPPADFTPKTLGDTIVIAWNQSMETARATRGAYLMLQQAKKVFVLTIKEAIVEGPTGEQMAERLRFHGIPTEAVTRSSKGASQGEAILNHAASLNADLLIKGAYTQSRLRQMIFGGATSHILARATIPVLMAS
jgi:nucleotide-binding universal stress UspA family protein